MITGVCKGGKLDEAEAEALLMTMRGNGFSSEFR